MPKEGLFLKATPEELKFVTNLSNTLGMCKNRLVFKALSEYAINHGVKVSQSISSTEKVLDIKQKERLTGDYVGSWEKENEKIKRIQESGLSEAEKKRLIADTKARYSISRIEMRYNLGLAPQEGDAKYFRKKRFAEKWGCELNDVGQFTGVPKKTKKEVVRHGSNR